MEELLRVFGVISYGHTENDPDSCEADVNV
jgi:hypothetical protein